MSTGEGCWGRAIALGVGGCVKIVDIKREQGGALQVSEVRFMDLPRLYQGDWHWLKVRAFPVGFSTFVLFSGDDPDAVVFPIGHV